MLLLGSYVIPALMWLKPLVKGVFFRYAGVAYKRKTLYKSRL